MLTFTLTYKLKIVVKAIVISVKPNKNIAKVYVKSVKILVIIVKVIINIVKTINTTVYHH